MEFYLSEKIDVTAIILDLALVVLTTGVTYFLFSILPQRRRKKLISKRLRSFRDQVNEEFLKQEFEFKPTYYRFDKKIIPEGKSDVDAEYWLKVHFEDWHSFISIFSMNTLLPVYFKNYWQGNELINLVNSLVMDDERFLELSASISRFSQNIEHIDTMLGDKTKDVWSNRELKEFIKTDHEMELISLAIGSMEENYQIAREMVGLIDTLTK